MSSRFASLLRVARPVKPRARVDTDGRLVERTSSEPVPRRTSGATESSTKEAEAKTTELGTKEAQAREEELRAREAKAAEAETKETVAKETAGKETAEDVDRGGRLDDRRDVPDLFGDGPERLDPDDFDQVVTAPPTPTEPEPYADSEFDPDDWSYVDAVDAWYSSADGRLHETPGGPAVAIPAGGVAASDDLRADAVDASGAPLDGDDLWFDFETKTFHDGPDGPVVGFHAGALADGQRFHNASNDVGVDTPIDDVPYADYPGDDVVVVDGHWYAVVDDGTLHEVSESPYIDFGDMRADVGDWLGFEAMQGTAMWMQGANVTLGPDGGLHAYDPSRWAYDDETDAWTRDGEGRYDRPDGSSLGPDESASVGPFDSALDTERLMAVSSDAGHGFVDTESGTYYRLDGESLVPDEVPDGPLTSAAATGPGAQPPFDALDHDGPLYVDVELGAVRADPDGPVMGFLDAVDDDGVMFENHQGEPGAHYTDFTGHGLRSVDGRWFEADDHGRWHETDDGRYFDMNRTGANGVEFLRHELVADTALAGVMDASELDLVVDAVDGSVHSYDPMRWAWDEATVAWTDPDGERYDQPNGHRLDPDETSEVGYYDSAFPVGQVTVVETGDGTTAIHDLEGDRWFRPSSDGVTIDETPPPPYTAAANPYGIPPLTDLDGDATVGYDPSSGAFRDDDGSLVGLHAGLDDAEVYTDETGEPVGYRSGGTWYGPDGTELADGVDVTVADLPPALRDALLADAGLEGAELDAGDGLYLDPTSGALRFDPAPTPAEDLAADPMADQGPMVDDSETSADTTTGPAVDDGGDATDVGMEGGDAAVPETSSESPPDESEVDDIDFGTSMRSAGTDETQRPADEDEAFGSGAAPAARITEEADVDDDPMAPPVADDHVQALVVEEPVLDDAVPDPEPEPMVTEDIEMVEPEPEPEVDIDIEP